MFERFHADARQAVVLSQEEARQMASEYIGCEHLLVALMNLPNESAGQALAAAGLEVEDVRSQVAAMTSRDALDPDALASLGIDLDAVRRSTEAAFGPGALERGRRTVKGHIPFTPDAKKCLELSLRESLRLKHNHISSGHLLLGILRADNPARRLLEKRDVNLDALRDDVTGRITSAA